MHKIAKIRIIDWFIWHRLYGKIWQIISQQDLFFVWILVQVHLKQRNHPSPALLALCMVKPNLSSESSHRWSIIHKFLYIQFQLHIPLNILEMVLLRCYQHRHNTGSILICCGMFEWVTLTWNDSCDCQRRDATDLSGPQMTASKQLQPLPSCRAIYILPRNMSHHCRRAVRQNNRLFVARILSIYSDLFSWTYKKIYLKFIT